MQKDTLNTIRTEAGSKKINTFTLSLSVVSLCVLLAMISFFVSGDGAEANSCYYERMSSGWIQVFSDGGVDVVTLPDNLRTEDGRVVIKTTIPEIERDDIYIVAEGDKQDIYMYVDGTCRESYCIPYKNGKTGLSPAAFVYMPVRRSDSGKQLTVEFYSAMPLGAGEIRDIYIGTDMGIWMSVAKYSGLSLCFGVITFALSFIVLITALIISFREKNFNEMFFLALGCIAFSAWSIFSNRMRQYVFPGNTDIYYGVYYIACFMQIPLAVYLNIIKRYRYDRLLGAASVWNFFAGICFSYLHMAGIFSFVEMYPYVIFFQAVLTVIFISILIYDIVTHNNELDATLTIGLIVFATTGVLEVARTLFRGLFFLTGVTSLGIIGMLACTIVSAAKQYAHSSSDRDAAIKLKNLRNEFLAAMSHEIRTPINGIIGLNNAILEVEKDKKVLAHASNVRDSAEELLLLVNDILDISQIEADKFRISNSPMYISTPVRRAVSDCREYAGYAGLMIDESDLPEDAQAYLGDHTRISAVLKNLIAYFILGYKTSGGKVGVNISISAEVMEAENAGFITYKITGPSIRISKTNDAYDDIYGVASNAVLGCMDSELTRNVKGLMCDGFEFTVVLAKTDGAPEQEEQTAKYDLDGKRVLITDDNEINRVILKKYVIKAGAGADAAESGEEAIELSEKVSYDLILMDMRMPHMDGKETMERIRDELGDKCPPIIVLTADDDPNYKNEYIADGFDDYLAKPVKYEDLKNLMMKHIQKKD